jgi:hypothetical protein
MLLKSRFVVLRRTLAVWRSVLTALLVALAQTLSHSADRAHPNWCNPNGNLSVK